MVLAGQALASLEDDEGRAIARDLVVGEYASCDGDTDLVVRQSRARQGLGPAGTPNCMSECQTLKPDFDDTCGAEMEAWINCIEPRGCDIIELDCISEFDAWDDCNDGDIEL